MRYPMGIAFLVSMLLMIGAGPGTTPQDLAADALESGRLTEVMEHVRKGADVNFKYEGGTTLLHVAAVVADAGWLITDLVKAGAEVNVQAGPTKSTPLHWAAAWGRPGNVRALLAAGAKRNQKDANKKTPLDKAKESQAASIGRTELREPDFEEVIAILSK